MYEKLGNYLIVKELGRGGMGIVYEARHAETSARLAVKVLPAQLALDPAFRQRFIREVKTLQRLDHPNIVHIRDSGHQEGALWYAMDFVEGIDLHHLLQKGGRLDPLRATRIVQGVALALAYSHAQNVIHRDIKPGNIMLGPDDHVLLTDFGVARMVDATRMTATAGVLGTVEYMSPEQVDGKVVDERSDIYSLGVVYYRAVTGKMPIDGASHTQIMTRIKTAQVSPPASWVPDLPRNVNDLIMQMIEKDRSRRILSAQALLRELDRIVRQLEAAAAGAEVSAEPVLTAAPPPSWWRSPWTAVLVLFIAALAGWRLLQRPPSPGAVMDSAERLASEGNYGEALSLLGDLLARSRLTPDQKAQADKLRTEMAEMAKVHGLAERVWAVAKWAKRQEKPAVELKLILLLLQEMPGTPQTKEARDRLADSLRLQELLRRADPNSRFLPPATARPPAKPEAPTPEPNTPGPSK